jgi:DNA-binding LacI/PurR family transcriptional regulator
VSIDRRSFVPLYVQLKNVLQRQILSGELPPGSALASEPALGQTFGVSRITVRQALGDLEAEGLIRREPGRGTFVAAASLRRGASVGLLFGGMSERTFGHRNDTSFGDLVQGIAAVASQRGVLVHPIPLGDEERLDLALASPSVHQLNGLLVRLARRFDEDVLQKLDATSLPYVVVKRRIPDGRASCVYSDDVGGAAALTTHLLDLGHRRVGLLLGPAEIGVFEDRLRGYRGALERAGLDLDPSLVREVGYPMDESGFADALALLRLRDPPTAFFAGNDYIAIGVYRAIRELGQEPGRDVAVVGYGGTSFSTTMYPALTTVRVGGRAYGQAAAALLLDLITGAVREPTAVEVPWQLEIRPSSENERRKTKNERVPGDAPVLETQHPSTA